MASEDFLEAVEKAKIAEQAERYDDMAKVGGYQQYRRWQIMPRHLAVAADALLLLARWF